MQRSPRAVSLVARPSCADPAVLPLVDAVYDRQGGARTQRLHLGMLGEHGVWGATTKRQRAQHGAPKPPIGHGADV